MQIRRTLRLFAVMRFWALWHGSPSKAQQSFSGFVQTISGSRFFLFLSLSLSLYTDSFSWLEWKHKTSQRGEIPWCRVKPQLYNRRADSAPPGEKHVVSPCRAVLFVLTFKLRFVFSSHCRKHQSLPELKPEIQPVRWYLRAGGGFKSLSTVSDFRCPFLPLPVTLNNEKLYQNNYLVSHEGNFSISWLSQVELGSLCDRHCLCVKKAEKRVVTSHCLDLKASQHDGTNFFPHDALTYSEVSCPQMLLQQSHWTL